MNTKTKNPARRIVVALCSLALLAGAGFAFEGQAENDGPDAEPAKSSWSALPDTQTVGRKITTASTSAVTLLPYRR